LGKIFGKAVIVEGWVF